MRKTLRDQIVNSIIVDYIDNGLLHEGDPLPPIRQLLQRYGVSSGTIMGAVAILQAQGIVISRGGSGCYIAPQKNSSNQNAVNEESNRIGLICNARDEYISIRLANGVDSICHQNGYTAVVAASNYSYEDEQAQVRRLIDSGCKGLILYPSIRTSEQVRNDYLNSEYLDFPIVLVDMALPEQNRPQVLFDNYRVGLDMTKYLLDKGHTRIAFMDYTVGGVELLHRSVADRYKGYRAAMQNSGLPILPEDRWVLNTHVHLDAANDIAKALLGWLELVDRPSALITLEDGHAASTVLLAQQLGIKVPAELEVVGFDDLPLGRTVRPSFTTTSTDFKRAGEVAADMVLQMIQSGTFQNVAYMLPVQILERNDNLCSELEAYIQAGCSIDSLVNKD